MKWGEIGKGTMRRESRDGKGKERDGIRIRIGCKINRMDRKWSRRESVMKRIKGK